MLLVVHQTGHGNALSVVNANNAIGQSYTQFSNAISDNNETGRSYTLSLRTSF